MQERQVTIGDQTFKLEEPFLVLATQNPIEQEGTYPLPEAQVDRFMLKLKIVYPSREEERQILDLMARTGPRPAEPGGPPRKSWRPADAQRHLYG
jgi:MoxR-like ATPase